MHSNMCARVCVCVVNMCNKTDRSKNRCFFFLEKKTATLILICGGASLAELAGEQQQCDNVWPPQHGHRYIHLRFTDHTTDLHTRIECIFHSFFAIVLHCDTAGCFQKSSSPNRCVFNLVHFEHFDFS